MAPTIAMHHHQQQHQHHQHQHQLQHPHSHSHHGYPTADTMDRHDYGVAKTRKVASTGGGRAWSEEEEVYLLQTRLQKMPYKHIAAHLKKTELACRLHYHQLSHGSGRRKRTTSVSSGDSSSTSPVLSAANVCETPMQIPRSITPPGSSGSVYTHSVHGTPRSPAHSLHLPAIHAQTPPAYPTRSGSLMASPRLPSILPKPLGMNMLPVPNSPFSNEPHSAPLGASFPRIPSPNPLLMHATTPNPVHVAHGPLPSPLPPTHAPHHAPPTHSVPPVDMHRLSVAYNTHKARFWAAVSAEYGPGASPAALEGAWERRRDSCCTLGSSAQPSRFALRAPMSPAASPEHHKEREDKTRISAILGVDATPRGTEQRAYERPME